MNNEKLVDLKNLIDEIKQKINNEFNDSDTELSVNFKSAFEDYYNDRKGKITFYTNSAVYTNSNKQKIYLPNQWFILASFMVEFHKAVLEYKEYAIECINKYSADFKNAKNNKNFESVFNDLKKNSSDANRFKERIKDYLKSKGQNDDQISWNVDLLYKFVTDPKWWCGGKNIGRDDFLQSAELNILNLVNVSSGYITEIIKIYTESDEILKELPNMVKQNTPLEFETDIDIDKNEYPLNRIVFGAPGTGKSYSVDKARKELVGDNDSDYERVTFHPDYSYANFVGTYKPVPEGSAITYKFVPGPFMRVYVNALKNASDENEDTKPFLLLIEEINRADVAAVFGDVFQLLDRDESGVSRYPIQASEDIKAYLSDELNVTSNQVEKIKIPNNMFIWATMNSADQGVFPMDTAFKRRWDFRYIGIDEHDEELKGKYVRLGSNSSKKIYWNNLRKAINDFLATELKINEDKQLGPYFISSNIVVPSNGDEINKDKFCSAFKDKVLMYLFEDAARQKRRLLFNTKKVGATPRYSTICDKFDEIDIDIFNEKIIENIKPERNDDSPDSTENSNSQSIE